MFDKYLVLIGALAFAHLTAANSWAEPTAEFVEDRIGQGPWKFEFHGYARLPVLLADGPTGERGPDLVDDNYGQSGFAYLRANETEWVEMTLSAVNGPTRVVAGILANQLSDWSDRQGANSTPAFAFVEHHQEITTNYRLKTRLGMFWRRLGYHEQYDTYLIGRTHLAGAMATFSAHELVEAEFGFGTHARNAREAFGFGPTYWTRIGAKWRGSSINGYYLKTVNEDDDPSRSYTKTGSLSVYGADLDLTVPYFGRAKYIFSFIDARNAEFIGRGVELLHSLDGKNLKLNFLGSEENGTGELQNQGIDFTWSPGETARAFMDKPPVALSDLELGIYGMMTWVATPHEKTDASDPGKNDRRYLKWGSDLRYRPTPIFGGRLLVAARFDRVVTHTDQDSLGFRVLSPRIGVDLTTGVHAFVQWSRYDYGDNITAAYFPELAEKATRSGNANLGEVRPDEDVFKLQVQATW